MIQIEKSFKIRRPVEDVFDYMSRFQNDAEWRAEIADIQPTANVGPGVGQRFEQVLDLSGRQVVTDFEITEFDTNRHIGFRGTSGDVRAEGAYDFVAEGNQTRIDVWAQVDVSGAAELTEPYIAKQLEMHGNEDFQRLRRLLESRA